MSKIRLGVNIDHVATVRNARGGVHPDPLKAALLAQQAGADGITAHLREDRRHISDSDIAALMTHLQVPLNLEMALTEEMVQIACHHKPHAVCLVPEKREEKTTEGGLDLLSGKGLLEHYIPILQQAGSRVSLFIDPDLQQIKQAKKLNVPVIEFHTGSYCEAVNHKDFAEIQEEWQKLYQATLYAHELGIEIHAGHGITYESVMTIATLPHLAELNIGHFLIGEAVFTGLHNAIRTMQHLIAQSSGRYSV